MREIDRIKTALKRLNQLILVFPVWIVVGFSGRFRRFKNRGWVKSEENNNYRRMY